jgi:hypothetical protein
LSLEIPPNEDNKSSWNVDVLDEGGRRLKGIRVFRPKHLPFCAATR